MVQPHGGVVGGRAGTRITRLTGRTSGSGTDDIRAVDHDVDPAIAVEVCEPDAGGIVLGVRKVDGEDLAIAVTGKGSPAGAGIETSQYLRLAGAIDSVGTGEDEVKATVAVDIDELRSLEALARTHQRRRQHVATVRLPCITRTALPSEYEVFHALRARAVA